MRIKGLLPWLLVVAMAVGTFIESGIVTGITVSFIMVSLAAFWREFSALETKVKIMKRNTLRGDDHA